jgi:hypothetical protein
MSATGHHPARAVFVVPGPLVDDLRESLLTELADTAHKLQTHASAASRRDGWQREPLLRMDGLRALLCQLGWEREDPQHDARVDLREHAWALLTAITHAQQHQQNTLGRERPPGHRSHARHRRLAVH